MKNVQKKVKNTTRIKRAKNVFLDLVVMVMAGVTQPGSQSSFPLSSSSSQQQQQQQQQHLLLLHHPHQHHRHQQQQPCESTPATTVPPWFTIDVVPPRRTTRASSLSLPEPEVVAYVTSQSSPGYDPLLSAFALDAGVGAGGGRRPNSVPPVVARPLAAAAGQVPVPAWPSPMTVGAFTCAATTPLITQPASEQVARGMRSPTGGVFAECLTPAFVQLFPTVTSSFPATAERRRSSSVADTSRVARSSRGRGIGLAAGSTDPFHRRPYSA